MSVVGLIFKALLALVGLGLLVVALFAFVILLVTCVKKIREEVQNDDSKNVS